MHNHTLHSLPNAARHAFGLVALTLAATLVLGACGDEKTAAEKASDLLAKGLQAHQEQNLDEAAKQYKKILELEPTNKFALYNLGVIEQAQGRPAEAEVHYRASIATDPVFSSALYNLALLRATAGATDEAEALYRRAIDANPQFADAHLNLGFLLRAKGEQAEGDESLRRAVELNASLKDRVGELPTTTTTTEAR